MERLRRRAYGPDADIANDASAQARLSELEAAERRGRTPVVGAAAASRSPASVAVPGPELLAGSLIADSDPADRGASAPWWRRRRILPWAIAAIGVLAAAITIGVSVDDSSEVVDESSEPKPVAQLTPQGTPGNASIPVDDQTLGAAGLTVADFVSYGSYGPLQIWSTTKVANNRCIAVVVEEHISVFECTAPSVDTIARFNIDPDLVPPGPSGELTPYIRFVLHDEVVDVYRPSTEGEFYR